MNVHKCAWVHGCADEDEYTWVWKVEPSLLCSKFYLLCFWALLKKLPNMHGQYYGYNCCTELYHSSYTIVLFLWLHYSIVRLQPVALNIMLCCSTLMFDLLCSWENFCPTLCQVDMTTIVYHKGFIKIFIYKSGDRCVNNSNDNDF